MTNDERFLAAVERLLEATPTPDAYPEQVFRWLALLAISAERARYYDLASEANRRIVQRWSYLGRAWSDLSGNLGKQGKFSEALTCIERARALPGIDKQILDGSAAVWLWKLDRKTESASMLALRSIPKPEEPGFETRLASDAYFHATCDKDFAAARNALEILMARPRVEHWRYWLRRDIGFDALRQEPWFIALAGPTALGQSPERSFQTILPSPGLDTVRILKASKEEIRAREKLPDLSEKIQRKNWEDAIKIADASLAGFDLPEAYMYKAIALTALDRYSEAFDTVREMRGRGLRCGDPPCDSYGLFTTLRPIITAFTNNAHASPGSSMRAATAVIIQSQLDLDWQRFEDCIRWMDWCEKICPKLPEIFNTRGIAKIKSCDLAGSEVDFSKALELRPDYADAVLNLAANRFEQEEHLNGLSFLKRARDLGAHYTWMDVLQMNLLAGAKRWVEAEHLMKSLWEQRQPIRMVANGGWALSSRYSLEKQYADAEKWTRKVIRLEPSWTSAWTKLSGDLSRQGRWEEALEAAQRHLDYEPNAYDGQWSVAAILAHLGRRTEAASRAATVAEPLDPKRKPHYLAGQAIYGAAMGDEDLCKRSLNAIMEEVYAERNLIWIRADPLLDPYRDKPWFKNLVPKSNRPAPPGML
jgi:tetratricopeptide (TPR) repeat protein